MLRVAAEVLATDADTLFLDRDGVINRYLPNDYVTSLNKFVILPGIPEVMAAWARRFRRIILVTNQRGIARGRFTMETLDEIHRHMLAVIEAAGGRIDAIYVSTAIPEDDPSRKPQPGMFLEACRDFPEIRAERSVMVGDADSDEAFARNCGMAFVRA
ncbi:MAG: HAD-IIIA family hydrolase [Bacteroidota bacterium]|nr:HAD-IIIA family hydrolase [Bacteroidota bacterium]